MPIYMKFEGVDGAVTAGGHEKWIELNSFSWGVGRGVSNLVGGDKDREASAPSVGEIVVTKLSDISSAGLFKEALHGTGKPVKIDFCKTDEGQFQHYYQFELENTLVSNYSLSSGGDRPMESLSLNYTKITFNDVEQTEKNKSGSPIRVSYDLAKGKVG